MKMKTSVKTTWTDLDWPCPHDDCNGTFKAKLPDFSQGKTVRCTRGHTITLTEDGSVSQVEKALRDFGR